MSQTFEEWYAQNPDFNGWEPTQQEHDIWNAALKYGIPEDYVLVPVELTEKMLNAWYSFKAMDEYANINDMWEVMLEAAQEEE